MNPLCVDGFLPMPHAFTSHFHSTHTHSIIYNFTFLLFQKLSSHNGIRYRNRICRIPTHMPPVPYAPRHKATYGLMLCSFSLLWTFWRKREKKKLNRNKQKKEISGFIQSRRRANKLKCREPRFSCLRMLLACSPRTILFVLHSVSRSFRSIPI